MPFPLQCWSTGFLKEKAGNSLQQLSYLQLTPPTLLLPSQKEMSPDLLFPASPVQSDLSKLCEGVWEAGRKQEDRKKKRSFEKFTWLQKGTNVSFQRERSVFLSLAWVCGWQGSHFQWRNTFPVLPVIPDTLWAEALDDIPGFTCFL